MTAITNIKKIDRIIKIIAGKIKPEKIILFGSYARGTNTPDSDVDLLVIMDQVRSKREQQLYIRQLVQDIRIPKDIVVTTKKEYNRYKNIVGTVAYPANREGKILYAR